MSSPFPSHAWPQVWRWIDSYRERAMDDEAPQTLEEFVELSRQLERTAAMRTWAVRRDGELGGLVMAQRVSPITQRLQVFFKRALWGTGTSEPAVREVLAQIFADEAVRKIITLPFEDNRAMHSFLRRIGFSIEGTMRSQTLRQGVPVGLTVFALLRGQDAVRNQ